jgi:hypothetical protein
MAGDSAAVFGIFTMRTSAEEAVDRLTAAGFSSQDVSVLISDKEGSREFAMETNPKAPEGDTTGAEVGGIVGGTLGLLAGMSALALPGMGALIAAGPILASLAGLGVGGAVGGLVGALVDLGIPEYEAKLYDGRLKDGSVLLSVRCVSCEEIARARDVLAATGAEDIASSGEETIFNEDKDHCLQSSPSVPNSAAHSDIASTAVVQFGYLS